MKTIALNERTFEILVELKEELAARTFEEVIKRLVERMRKVSKNMFGIDKRLKPFTEKEEAEFEGES